MHFDPVSLVAMVTALFSVGGQTTETVTRCDTVSGTSTCTTFQPLETEPPFYRPGSEPEIVRCHDGICITIPALTLGPFHTHPPGECNFLTNAAGQSSMACFGPGLQPPPEITRCNSDGCVTVPALTVASSFSQTSDECTFFTNAAGQSSMDCFGPVPTTTSPGATPTGVRDEL